MLTQKTLVQAVANNTGCTLKEATRSVQVVMETIKDEIAGGGEVHFNGLLSVKRQQRAARTYKVGGSQTVDKPAHERPVISLSLPLVKEATKDI